MFHVSVKNEGTSFVVVVENPETKYRFVGNSYTPKKSGGPFGPSQVAVQEAFDRAQADAADWVERFRTAHIKAEVAL